MMIHERLTRAQARFYHVQGYLLPGAPVFAPARFAALSAIFEDLYARRETLPRPDLDLVHFDEPRLLDFLLDDAVLDLVEPLIGPDIGLWSSHFICKEPHTGKRTPWHQDSEYWRGRLDRFDNIVTVWLALDRTDRANGCMRVVAGTHRADQYRYEPVDRAANIFGSEIVPEQIDRTRIVDFELAANECSLHDSRIVHGAEANTSPRRRCGYTMRYFSLAARVIPDANPGHRLWHCRGRNLGGNLVENPEHEG